MCVVLTMMEVVTWRCGFLVVRDGGVVGCGSQYLTVYFRPQQSMGKAIGKVAAKISGLASRLAAGFFELIRYPMLTSNNGLLGSQKCTT